MLFFFLMGDVDIEISDTASSLTAPSCQRYARLAATAANTFTCHAKGGMSSKGVTGTTYLTLIPCCPCDQSNLAISSTTLRLTEVDKQVGGGG